MTPHDLTLPTVDDAAFRNVVGHFASGVTVITTAEGAQLHGTTVSAFSSLSLDPPMVLVCLNRSSSTHDALQRTGRFAVSVLSARQGELAVRFARPLDDRFAGVDVENGPAGLPLLGGRLAGIECEIIEAHTGGTHTVFFGRVLSASAHAGDPLAYYRGQFGEFREARERHAFTAARRWILQREVSVGGEIDVERMAGDLGITTTTVYNTLVRLGATGLVAKDDDDGSFRVAPLTAEAVDGLYVTRFAIESGVVDEYLGDADPSEIASLAEQARTLAALPLGSGAEVEAFLERNLEFHAAVVALSRSRELVERFRECSVAAAWRTTSDERLWQRQLGHELLADYARALSERDVPAAQRLLRRQRDFVREAARISIEARGGAI